MKKVLACAAILVGSFSLAANYNAQAEKDRLALIKYYEKVFADPAGKSSVYFPYTPEKELKENYIKGIKWKDFVLGSYAYAKGPKEQYLEMIDFPPYLDNIDHGEELYNSNKALKECFPDPAKARAKYPMFDQKKKEVVTLTVAINDCLKSHGQKPWNMKKGDLADVEAYFAAQAKENGLKVNVQIPSKEAEDAYMRGRKYYYSQRGYLKLSCANCHVQGVGKRTRRDYLSPAVGQVAHFPVYRLAWQELGTLERRISGCLVNMGQKPVAPDSKQMRELIYFLSYMSNGLPYQGPDVRK